MLKFGFKGYEKCFLKLVSHHKHLSQSTYPPKWEKNAKKEIGSDSIESLEWKSPEGIILKPLYTADDIKAVSLEVPGEFPFTRGPYATMYTAKP